jgi:monoamine oxidase
MGSVMTFLFLFYLFSYSYANVIVIGAGAAGLSAATELKKAGILVRILEARERIGGRINTDFEHFGYPVELGAVLITEQKDNPLVSKANENGVRLVDVDFSKVKFFGADGVSLGNVYPSIIKVFENYVLFVKFNYEKLKNFSVRHSLMRFIMQNKLTLYQKSFFFLLATFSICLENTTI